MPKEIHAFSMLNRAADTAMGITEIGRQESLLKTGALQSAIFNSANFSSIATDAKGVIQIFNVGAERMLGYAAAEVMNKITPADISDPQEVIARAKALSTELGTPITPGFEALVFKASRGIEDIYELTYIRKDGSRFPAVVSVTALRDDQGAIIGYLLIGTDNTARKKAEEALLKAGALQNAIFNSANFSSIATDAKGVIQIFNVGAERMLGYAAAEVMNKITPADISDPQEVIARAKALSTELGTPITPGFEALVFKASRGIEDIYELTYIRKDGSRFPAVVSVTALRDDQGAIIGYLLIGTDNTERKLAEKKLLASETRYRRLFEAGKDGILILDADTGMIVDVNPFLTEMLGFSHKEFLGKHIWDLGFFKDIVANQANFLELQQKEYIRYEDLPLETADGRRINVEFISSLYQVSQGRVIQCSIRVAHLASFPRQNPYPVVEVGTDGVVRFANVATMATLARLGLDPDPRQFLPGTPEELLLLRSQCERNPQTQELRLGGATFLRVVAAPPGGDSLHVYALDITERNRMEEEIRALNADLDLRVRQRTAELTAANTELGAFSYSVSHDLRAPLRSIDGFSQAFVEDFGTLVPPEGREELQRVRNATQRMGQLIDDMLLLSQVTRREMHMQETDMSALAAEVAEELAQESRQRDVQLTIEPGMTAAGDPQLLRIVLVNLLGNAWKFTSKREHAHVSVGTVRDPERGPAFFVRDDGAGFDAKYKDKLFVAFQRLHAQEEFPGTGIGLATVQRAVRRHGGNVWAEGEVDRGATFYFTIADLHISNPVKGEQP
jgi:PAS domain S-box-containing protein